MTGQKRSREAVHQELLLRKRIEVVKRLKLQLDNPKSLASQTVTAYAGIVDDLLEDVVLDVHRGVCTGEIDLQDTQTDVDVIPAAVPVDIKGAKPGKPSKVPRTDAFGQDVGNAANTPVACTICGKKTVASRFASHLASCLSGGGRHASRCGGRRKNGVSDAG